MVMAQRVNGTINTREGIRQVVNDPMFPDLTNEDKRELERRYQDVIRDTEKDMYRDVERTTLEINKSKFKKVEAKLMFDTSASVARLRYTADPNAQNLIVQEMLENAIVAAEASGLGTAEQLELRASVYQQVRSAVGEQQAEALGVNKTLEDFSFVQEEINRYETLYAKGEGNGGISWATKEALVTSLLLQYPSVKGVKFVTAEAAQQAAVDRQALIQKMRDLTRQDYEFNNAAPVLDNAVIAEAALELIADPSRVSQYQQLDTGDNRRVLDLYEHLAQQQKELSNPARTKQLADSNAAMQKAQGTLAAIQMYRSDREQYDAAKLAGLAVPDITDLGVQKAEADLQRATTEYQAVANSIAVNLGELQKYGVAYDQATGQLGLLQSVADELATIRKMPVGGGSTPPKSTSAPVSNKAPGSALGPGLIRSGFAGMPKPGVQKDRQGNILNPTGGGGKPVVGSNGSVQVVPPVREVFRKHFVDNTPVGSYDFTLIDKNNKTQTAIPSPVTGIVTEVSVRGGYGNVVAVYDPNTNKEWFIAHMAGQAPVKVGQQVVAGQKIGVQGSTGNSTGDHIHLEILAGKWAEGGKIITNRATTQPLVETYLKRTLEGGWPSSAPNSLGLPPSQSFGNLPVSTSRVPTYALQHSTPPPPGAMVLPGGGYILGGVLRLPSLRQTSTGSAPAVGASQFNNNRPLAMPQTSRYREDYPPKNDPTANYGYDTIAKDPAFARALAATADRLDIPAQWLADIMAFESTQDGVIHNPRAQNAQGAVGLIQFYPGGGLAEVAKGMNVSEAEAKRRLLGMTRAQQMPWVENHLKLMLRYAGKTKYERMDDVFAAIFGGQNLLAKDDAARQSVGDSAISYAAYRQRIGHHVGRSYSTTRGSRPTHRKHQPGCPTCTQMMQSQGKVIPHQSP
jgi:murein DD-endopeptidase MepM/ murein hydrolase activator NlpD